MELAQMIDPAMLAKIAVYIVLVNGCLLGLHKILESIAKVTDSKADDKAAEIMGKVLGGLSKVVEIALGSLGKK